MAANRSLFDSPKVKNVLVETAGGPARRRAHHDIFQGKLLVVTLTLVVFSLLSSNCLSLARLTPNQAQPLPQQTWPMTEDSPIFYGNQQQTSFEGRNMRPAGGETSDLIDLDDLPASYYVGSAPQPEMEFGRQNFRPAGYNEHTTAGRPLLEPLDGGFVVGENQDEEAKQEFGQNKNNFYYPLVDSPPNSDSNSDKNSRVLLDDLDESAQSLEFKSKLAELVDLEEKLSQLSSLKNNNNNNYDNTDSYDNIKIANPTVRVPTLVEPGEEQSGSVEQSKSAKDGAKKAFTLLEDERELLSASNQDDKRSVQEPAEPATTTASYGTVVTGRTDEPGAGSEQQPGGLFNRMYRKLSGYLPFLSQMNILRNGAEKAANETATHKTVQEEKGRLLAEFPAKRDKDELPSTKQSVSGPAAASAAASASGEANKVSLLRESSGPVVAINEAKNEPLVATMAPTSGEQKRPVVEESLIGRYIYAPVKLMTRVKSETDDTDDGEDQPDSKATPVKKLAKLSRRLYSSRRHPEEEDEELEDLQAAADEVPEELGYHAPLPTRPYRHPYYSHRRLVELDEPLANVRQQNKTNDLYFLIMVGSFCAMAVAVVLAAGLFAYRVQQNRKTTTETDYPTYGVVGPNNMTGGLGGAKLGAASFVGGYFNSNLGAGGPMGVCPVNGQLAVAGGAVKLTGGAKQLADFYTVSDSGILSSTTGSSKSSASGGRRISSDHPPGYNNSQPGNSNAKHSASTANDRYAAANCQDAARMYHYQSQKQQMIISDRSSARHNSASDLDSEDENDDGSYTVYECPGLASAHEMEIKNPLFNDDQTP